MNVKKERIIVIRPQLFAEIILEVSRVDVNKGTPGRTLRLVNVCNKK